MNSSVRKLIREITPPQVRKFFWNYYYLIKNSDIKGVFLDSFWWFDRKYFLSSSRLIGLKNCHQGQRCFIIGNGPSLRKMDLSLLKNEITFGLNRIYLLFSELGFQTTYYVSVNKLVIMQFAKDIKRLTMPKFISWYARDEIHFSKNVVFIRDPQNGTLGFSKNPIKSVWEGWTVTYVAMQLAYFMGFSEVILIGVDHSFMTKGEPNEEVFSKGDDPNHFSKDYFSKGVQWQLPDLDKSERSYKLAKKYYEENNRNIYDATINGNLTIFKKIDYYSLFKQ